MMNICRNYKDKKLTVLICCYNTERFLNKCLDSLVQQKIRSSFYNILFIDDASTDNSFKIAESYKGILKNLAILRNKKNMGLVKCCNKALDAIETPYFTRLDSDDYLSFDALEKILNDLDSLKKRDFIVFQRWDTADSLAQNVKVSHDIYTWVATGVVFRKAAVESAGGYKQEHWEEYDLYLRLLERGFRYKISPYRIYYYRRGHNSMTHDFEKNKEGFKKLSRKWGMETLNKYGNFKEALKYYKVQQ